MKYAKWAIVIATFSLTTFALGVIYYINSIYSQLLFGGGELTADSKFKTGVLLILWFATFAYISFAVVNRLKSKR